MTHAEMRAAVEAVTQEQIQEALQKVVKHNGHPRWQPSWDKEPPTFKLGSTKGNLVGIPTSLIWRAFPLLGLDFPGVVALQKGKKIVLNFTLPSSVIGPVQHPRAVVWVDPPKKKTTKSKKRKTKKKSSSKSTGSSSSKKSS